MAQRPAPDDLIPAISIKKAMVPNAAVIETSSSEPVRLSPPGMYGLALYLSHQLLF
jgi:hypothetical protein